MSFEAESRLWEAEVDEEAARLVRLGVPPWDAVIQARQRVEQKRRSEASAALKAVFSSAASAPHPQEKPE